MSAVQQVLATLEAVNESKEQHLLALHLSAPLAAVARAAMAERAAIQEEREGSPFGGPIDPFNGVRAKARRALDAALDAFEAAAVRSLNREDRNEAAQPAVEGVDDGT